MTLRRVDRVTLENWRSWQDRNTVEGLPEGLVVLAGPNALGKTGLWEAIIAGLLDRHWGTHTDRLRPAGTKGVLPRVEVEFCTADRRYRVEKHFGGTRDRASLWEFVGEDWVLRDQGEEAYLLCRRAALGTDGSAPSRGGPDRAVKDTLMEVLLPAQGNLTAEAPAPEAISVAITDREAAGSATRIGRILTAVSRRADAVWVGQRNRPKKGTALAEGRARLEEIAALLLPLEEKGHRIGELVSRLVTAGEALSGRDEAEARNAKANELRAEVKAHRVAREAARVEEEKARREKELAESLLADRGERVKAAADATEALAAARQQEKSLGEDRRRIEVDHEEQLRRRQGLSNEVIRLREWTAYESRGIELEHLTKALEEIGQRIATATEAEQAAAKDEAELEALLLPKKGEWAEWDDLQQRLHEAEGSLKAGAWAVTGDVPGGTRLTVDGEESESGSVELEATREVVLAGDDGRLLSVTAPRGEAELVQVVRAEIRAYLIRFGVADITELRKRNDYVRADLSKSLALARQRRTDALKGGTQTDLLREEIELRSRLEKREAQRVPGSERPDGHSEQWEFLRKSLEADLEVSAARVEEETGRLHSARTRACEAAKTVAAREQDLVVSDGALAAHRADHGPDDDLRATLATALAVHGEKQEAWRKLEEERPMAEDAREDRAEGLSAGLAEILEKQKEVQRLEAGIESLRREDPEGRLADLETERAELLPRMRSEETKAGALLLLERSLTEEKDRVTQAIGEPVRERMKKWIRYLLQDDSEVVVDENGRPAVIRSPAGQEVPFVDQSFGTREQVSILYRLAVADLVAEEAGSGVCMMLDDPFGHTDRGRRERLLEILTAEADRRGHQILVFTCRPEDFEGVGHHVQLSRRTEAGTFHQ